MLFYTLMPILWPKLQGSHPVIPLYLLDPPTLFPGLKSPTTPSTSSQKAIPQKTLSFSSPLELRTRRLGNVLLTPQYGFVYPAVTFYVPWNGEIIGYIYVDSFFGVQGRRWQRATANFLHTHYLVQPKCYACIKGWAHAHGKQVMPRKGFEIWQTKSFLQWLIQIYLLYEFWLQEQWPQTLGYKYTQRF